MISLLVRVSSPLGPRTTIVRAADEHNAAVMTAALQSQGLVVAKSECTGRKTVAELIAERDKRAARAEKRKKLIVVELKDRRA